MNGDHLKLHAEKQQRENRKAKVIYDDVPESSHQNRRHVASTTSPAEGTSQVKQSSRSEIGAPDSLQAGPSDITTGTL
jgi:hypothetical protein